MYHELTETLIIVQIYIPPWHVYYELTESQCQFKPTLKPVAWMDVCMDGCMHALSQVTLQLQDCNYTHNHVMTVTLTMSIVLVLV